jgi:hypothetical protein
LVSKDNSLSGKWVIAVVTMSGRRTISSHIGTGRLEAIDVAEVTLPTTELTGGHSGISEGLKEFVETLLSSS